jgi:hypothetical protein
MVTTNRVRVAQSSLYITYEWEPREPESKIEEREGIVIMGWEDNQILFHIGSERIEGTFVGAKEDPNENVTIYYKNELGYVDRFCIQDILNELHEESEKIESFRELVRLYPNKYSPDTLKRCDLRAREISIQWRFFCQLLENYFAYGPKKLASFFDGGKEVKKKNLKKNLKEIASEILIPGYEKKEYKSFSKGAEEISKKFLSYGSPINAESLASTAKQIYTKARSVSGKK